jgi:hypothetical protein
MAKMAFANATGNKQHGYTPIFKRGRQLKVQKVTILLQIQVRFALAPKAKYAILLVNILLRRIAMILNIETLTALSALSGRIIAPIGAHPESAKMAALFNDLSLVESETLHMILKSERQGHGVKLEQKQFTALKLLQERLYQKNQVGAFVPAELAALAECTGIQSPATAHDKSDGDLSLASIQDNTAESNEADQLQWKGSPQWFREA